MTDRVPAAHPAWLPDSATAVLADALLDATGPLAATVATELAAARTRFGAPLTADPAAARVLLLTLDRARALTAVPGVAAAVTAAADLPAEGWSRSREEQQTVVVGRDDRGLLYGMFALLRNPGAATGVVTSSPRHHLRMLDHWDNMVAHPTMGAVERGYAGESLFFRDGQVRSDLARVEAYARLLASVGINRVAINNVNVHRTETDLLRGHLRGVVRIAEILRRWGIRLHLSVNFAAPVVLGDLETADPCAEAVAAWWRDRAAEIYARIPDFGGFVVKADSEGQPGPFGYGRDHADGANMLARALAPHGGLVHWRAFVYDHRQDWRDRSTDRARAAYDHFAPLDGRFEPNVVLQVKHGPIDFQVREPVSPVIAALPRTRLAVELQITQEYTGQQQHVCWLGDAWAQVLRFPLADDERTSVGDLADGGIVAVSNVGTDAFWTGHPLAQANLFTEAALAWDHTTDPRAVLQEWASATFVSPRVAETVVDLMVDSWQTYEAYTAPLGVGFMVRPGHHYGPDVDGYEYTPWGTYHFADRDGIGVDRTVSTGTGFTGQYPEPWASRWESLAECPDALLLFFHHVPYHHRLHSGSTVIQHIYDTHFAGVERVRSMVAEWAALEGAVEPAVFDRVARRLAEQHRSAVEWRDQLCSYFWRKSGVADERGRTIHP